MNQNSIRISQQDGEAGQLKTFGRKITILDFEVKYQAFYLLNHLKFWGGAHPKNPSRYTKISKLGLGFFGIFWDFLGFFGIGIFWDFLGFFGFFKFPNWDWDFLGFFGFFKFPNWDWVFLGFFGIGIFWGFLGFLSIFLI